MKREGAKNSTSPPGPIKNLFTEASRCVKCGRCLSVCPVYKETGREPEVTRGKLSLIELTAAGEIQPSPKKLNDIISFCLLCGACAENCPNLVPGDSIIQKAREIFVSKKNGLALPYRFILSHILPFPKRMDEAHRAGKALQPILLKKVPSESGLHWRFPLLRDQKQRFIPPLATESFLKRHSRKKPSLKPSITLFVGCVSNYMFPDIAEAVLNVFQYLNISVYIPPEQACCGLMAFGTGMKESYRKLAKKNIEAYESTGPVPIVAFCSSCSSHLKKYYELFEDKEWRCRARAFSQRVKDFSEFLVETGFQTRSEGKPIRSCSRLTFHDPCHLRLKQGIFAQPRYLLQSLKGVEFIDTGEENLCCGSGGSFNLSHYGVSLNIFKRRLKSIEQAGVDTVVTSCMGCLLQFLDGLYQEGKNIRVKHLAEILAEASPHYKSPAW